MYLDFGFETDELGLGVILAASEHLRAFRLRLRSSSACGANFAVLLKIVAYPWLDSGEVDRPRGRFLRSYEFFERESGRVIATTAVHGTVWVRHSDFIMSSSPIETVNSVAQAIVTALQIPAFRRAGVDTIRLREEIVSAAAPQ